ncbi:MAG: hypothetical protein A3C35_08645 [Omnitrophica bacterium RIFCSPHIGHO2_02_FULL_46_11]|nr:MAG: hypothetical protein A3A81_00705 [Omnitrophica bacterium RIFCSPLOWO2_01_FULL_45_10b]OGW87337.1 MAG: hypothetical protein A3C35_08645 [Omnitrophica bacterium RIFCSPHIGHO2_02_FULL_46_11]
MKKIALFLAVLMVFGSMPAWCLSEIVDKVIENKSKSDIRPIQDTARILGLVNEGIDKSLDKTPILNKREVVLVPVRKVARETIHGTKAVVNGTWDVVTSPVDRMTDKEDKKDEPAS